MYAKENAGTANENEVINGVKFVVGYSCNRFGLSFSLEIVIFHSFLFEN